MNSPPSFSSRIHLLHEALAAADLPHAFGGAIALGWCTPQARGTNDIDINIFLLAEEYETALDALPAGIEVTGRSRKQLGRDGQTRLWWDKVPVDIFLSTTDFHHRAATRVRHWDFLGVEIPCLSCGDLAIFKAFFDRGKDWVDIAAMASIDSIDIAEVVTEIRNLLGDDDGGRVAKLEALRG